MKRIDIVHIIEEYNNYQSELMSSYPLDKPYDESLVDYRKRKIKEYNEWLQGEVE